jgi:hypothetical protein
VGNSVFYCELDLIEENWEFEPGVYRIPDRTQYSTKIQRCMSYSKQVWIEGPRGKVRQRIGPHGGIFKYVTDDEEKMKEFMWVKLKAQPLKNYT